MIDGILKEAQTKMGKSVDHLQEELTHIRTGRANPALVDAVMVPYYGTPTPLNQLAQISTPEARMILISVYDRGQIGTIEKAIRDANLGLNPANDGQVIRVPVPPLTEERRRDYVKMVKAKAEETRIAIRNIRREEVERIKHQEKAGEIAEDAAKRGLEQLQKVTDGAIANVDGVAARKEAEVMEV